MKKNSPAYPFQLILENNTPYTTISVQISQILFSKQKQTFQKILFSWNIMAWNKIYVNIGHYSVCNVFKRVILKFIGPERNEVFNVDNSEWLKFLTGTRLRLRQLVDHKYWHNFSDCVNPICSCGQEIETSVHVLLHYSNYHCARQTLFKYKENWFNYFNAKWISITKLLLFSNEKLKAAQSKSILASTIEFLQAIDRFKTSLFN